MALAEALAAVDKTGERLWEAELYPQGSANASVQSPRSESPKAEEEAEVCFRKAIEIAQKQQASRSNSAPNEPRALWQRQGKQKEAHRLLSEIYNWFTEGFDTKDLQEARRCSKN